jgi:hypothetical protein
MENKQNSTGGTTPQKGEAVEAMAGVGGVRSSDEPVPDLWFGQPTEERRDTTCSAARMRNEELVTAREGYKCKEFSRIATPRWHRGFWLRCKELGKTDAGKPPVRFDEGRGANSHWPKGLSIRRFPPTLHAVSYSILAMALHGAPRWLARGPH